MVILGAGASYDSVNISLNPQMTGPAIAPFRPPLANELFDPGRDNFARIFDNFPDLAAIAMRVRRAVARGVPVEDVLKEIEDEATGFPAVHRQLLATRCYLQRIIGACGTMWRGGAHGLTHYAELINEVERWRLASGQPVLYVTFNYDTMLEADLAARYGSQFTDMASYRTSEFILFKLHGSVDWGRLVPVPREVSQFPAVDGPGVRRYLFEHAGSFTPGGFVQVGTDQWAFEEFGVIPAMAIPVQAKQVFECPDDQVQDLSRVIATTRGKVITIGWRGLENHFLEMWKPYNDFFDLLVVSGSKTSGDETLMNLQAGGMVDAVGVGTKYRRDVFDGGFGDLIGSGDLRAFLESPETTP